MGPGNKGATVSSGDPTSKAGQQAQTAQDTKEKIDKINTRLTEEINLRNRRPGRQPLLVGGALQDLGSTLPSSNNSLLSIGNQNSGR